MSQKCPACGAVYGADARFCTRDGTRLIPALGGSVAPAAMPAAPPAATPAAAPAAPRPTAARAPAPGVPARPTVNHANMVGQLLDGRYQIARKLGEGGMSYVYLGHDVGTKEAFAIKILSPNIAKDQNAMARLRREAALGMKLAHPNVCHIVRLGETEDGLVYVVMPFVQGEILSDRTHRRGGFLPLDETVRFVAEIAAGLSVAHALDIVHRDLKPENIMVTRHEDGTEHAVVMDFGLAKERRADAELQKLTATGIILGTPEFMSPEQLRGKPLDGRTDVYSLALMAYEMLTGKLPFEGRTQQELMINRLRNEPIPIRQRRPDLEIPEAVERVLLRGMHRDLEQRYPSAVQFADDLVAAARAGGGPPAGDVGGGLLGKLFGGK